MDHMGPNWEGPRLGRSGATPRRAVFFMRGPAIMRCLAFMRCLAWPANQAAAGTAMGIASEPMRPEA